MASKPESCRSCAKRSSGFSLRVSRPRHCDSRHKAGGPHKRRGARKARRREGKVCKIAKSEGPRINGEITARVCRLIGVDGSQLGQFGVRDALRIASEQGLDLVEIAPNAEPRTASTRWEGRPVWASSSWGLAYSSRGPLAW